MLDRLNSVGTFLHKPFTDVEEEEDFALINRFFLNGEFDAQAELGFCISVAFLESFLCSIISETIPSIECGSGLYYPDNSSLVIWVCRIH